MSLTFKQLYLLLQSRVKPLPIGEAQIAVQNAYRDILDYVPWSFLLGQGFINIPSAVLVNATVVSGFTITLDQPSNASLLASQSIERPVIGRQFRYSLNFLYTIQDYNPGPLSGGIPTGTGTLTLDRQFWDDVAAPFGANIYLAYVTPPTQPDGSIDFVAFLSIVSRLRSWPIAVAPSRVDVDNADPRRVFFGPVQALIPFDTVTINGQSGIERYELYPHPQDQDQLICYFRRSGLDFTNDSDTPPAQITPQTIRSCALYYAYDWAESNKGQDKSLQGPNWFALAQKANQDYMKNLQRCNVKDRDSHLRRQSRGFAMLNNILTVTWNGQSVTFPVLNNSW